MVDANDFPRSAGAVTPRWLTSALRESGELEPDVEVASVAWEPIGDGYAATTVRLSLEYSGTTAAPASIAAKFASSHQPLLEIARLFRLYERECQFYRQLAAPADVEVGVRVPRPYAVEFDRKTHEFALLLEDLADARPGDHVAGARAEELPELMRQYARMHARWWDAPELEELRFLHTEPAVVPLLQAGVEQAIEPTLELAAERFNKAHSDRFAEVPAAFTPVLERFRLQSPRSLLQGDAHIANVMFPSDGSAPVFLDWQLATRGHPIEEIARFLLLSVDPDVRRELTPGLLRVYSEELARGGVDLPAEECERLLPAGFVLHLGLSALASANVDTSSEQGQQTFAALAHRLAGVLEDLDIEAAAAAIEG